MRFNNRAWITKNEAECLVKYCSDVQGEVVDIGTFQGGGTKIIREYTPDEYPVWTIDIFDKYPESVGCKDVHEYLKYYENLFMIIGDSQKIGLLWHRMIHLLIVDGNHHENPVRIDTKEFGKWVIEGGIMILHDAANQDKTFPVLFGNRHICSGSTPGVGVVLKELLENYQQWELVEIVDTMAVLKRVFR